MITETMIFGSQKKVAQYIDNHDIKRTDYLYLWLPYLYLCLLEY